MAKNRRKRAPVEQTKVVTTGTVVRIETPQSDRGKPHVTVSPEFIPGYGFVRFLREHAIVGLAIGFVIATQVQALVKLLVDSFINPMVILLFGHSLSSRNFHLSFHGRTEPFNWGAFAYGLLDFLFVLAAIYLLIQILNLDRLDKPKKGGPSG